MKNRKPQNPAERQLRRLFRRFPRSRQARELEAEFQQNGLQLARELAEQGMEEGEIRRQLEQQVGTLEQLRQLLPRRYRLTTVCHILMGLLLLAAMGYVLYCQSMPREWITTTRGFWMMSIAKFFGRTILYWGAGYFALSLALFRRNFLVPRPLRMVLGAVALGYLLFYFAAGVAFFYADPYPGDGLWVPWERRVADCWFQLYVAFFQKPWFYSLLGGALSLSLPR